MSRRSKRNRSGADAWVDHALEAPRAALPDERLRRHARWKRRYVWVATFTLPVALAANAFVFFNIATDSEEQVELSGAQMDDITLQARALATATVTDWLGADPSPLPGGQLMSWNHVSEVDALAPMDTDSDGEKVPWQTVLMHDLTVTDGSTVYSVAVATSADPLDGVHLIGSPSLMPYAPAASSGYTGSLWPGAQQVTASESVTESVGQWARAFTGDDPGALRLTVGDPETGHSYMPLVGSELAGVDIVKTTVQQHLLSEEGRAPNEPEQVVVRAELSLDWNPSDNGDGDSGGDGGDGDSSSRQLQPVTYDLLVDRANTASPHVVAWGGPGTGPNLRPYDNAVAGRTLEVVEQDDFDSDEGEPADVHIEDGQEAEED